MRLFVGNPQREPPVNRNDLGKHSAWLRLFLINVSFWVACGSCAPFLSAYYKRIGLSFTQIGVLLAIGPIFAIFIQPLWAMLSDRTGKRKLLLILLALCTAGAYLLYYLGTSFAVCLLAVLVVSLFSLALLPLCDALVIDRANAYGFPFARIRIGVGHKPQGWDLADHVLGRFPKEEEPLVREGLAHAVQACEVILDRDVNAAMNQFNNK